LRGRAALLFALLPSLVAADGPLDGVRREVLDNGLVVLLLPEPASPLASVGVMYRVGARNEGAGTTGLAHYCEHMNFRATRSFPDHEITDSITRHGGRWSGYTWIDQTWYRSTMGRGDLDHMLALEADRMSEALYDPEDFKRERTSVLAELDSYDDPNSVLYDAVLASVFLAHPYRNNTIGWPSDVEGVTREEAWGFYRRYYHPNNAVLVVAGDIAPETALASIRARFASLPAAGETTEVRTVEPPQKGQRRVTLRQPGPHSRLLLAFRAPALLDPDFPALVLLDALLAGGKGLRFLRDYPAPPQTPLLEATRGLVTDVKTAWQASRYPYVYTVSASLASANVIPAAEEAIFRLLASAADREWTEAQRRQAMLEVARGTARDLDTQGERIQQLAFFEVAGGYRELIDLPARLERVTSADLRRVARERFRPELATVGSFVATPAAPDAAATRLLAGRETTPGSSAPTTTTAAAVAESARPTPARAIAARPLPRTVDLGRGGKLTIAPVPGASLVALRGRLATGLAREGLLALAVEHFTTPQEGEDTRVAELAWTLVAEPEAAINRRAVEFTATGLAADAPALLRLADGRLRGAVPEGARWDRLREKARRRAQERAETLDTALHARALQTLFPAAPPPWGSPAAIDAVTRDELVAFLRSGLGPPQLVAAGAVTADLASAATGFAGPAEGRPAGANRPVPRGPSSWTELRLPWPASAQNELRIVWPADLSRPHDRAAVAALLYLLGETGYAGRLGKALVEPGLVYSVTATLEDDYLMVRTAASPAHTRETLTRIRALLETATRSFTEADLAEAKSYRRGKNVRAYEGAMATAATLAEPEAADDSKLTLDQLDDTARRLFRNGAPIALVGGPGY